MSASQRGNKRLKNLLVFSCNCLARSRNRWGDHYARCRDRGMPHGKTLKAVARKRLKVIYAIMRDKVDSVRSLTAGGDRGPGRACVSIAENAHRKGESPLTEL